MSTALDTNVVIDIGSGDPIAAEQALRSVEVVASDGAVIICGAVYGELCASPVVRDRDLDAVLAAYGIGIDIVMPAEVWRRAGEAFGAYARRRRTSGGGPSRRLLADFIIGAHACRVGTLVTRDAEFYRRAFPNLRVVEVR